MAAARPMPVKAPVINTTGLLIFRSSHDFALPAGGAWMAIAGKLMRPTGVIPRALPLLAKWGPLLPAQKTL
jgi:hypothetical protein